MIKSVRAAGAKVEGTGTVKTVVLTSDAKDVVDNPGTKIEEEQGEAPGTKRWWRLSNVPTPSMSIAGIYIDGEKEMIFTMLVINSDIIPDDAEKIILASMLQLEIRPTYHTA